jgi:hypothetical protein
MLYRLSDKGAAGLPFDVIIDDKTMRWTTDPPGGVLDGTSVATFSAPGPYGDDKPFKLFPNGRARPA